MCVWVGGDSENRSCRIRFGSETRQEPTERRVIQTAGRFITRCSMYLAPVSFSIKPCPLLSEKDGKPLDRKSCTKRREKRMRQGKETGNSTTARLDKNSNINLCHSIQGCCFVMNASINLHYKRSQ